MSAAKQDSHARGPWAYSHGEGGKITVHPQHHCGPYRWMFGAALYWFGVTALALGLSVWEAR